jgi:hypothetical protein
MARTVFVKPTVTAMNDGSSVPSVAMRAMRPRGTSLNSAKSPPTISRLLVWRAMAWMNPLAPDPVENSVSVEPAGMLFNSSSTIVSVAVSEARRTSRLAKLPPKLVKEPPTSSAPWLGSNARPLTPPAPGPVPMLKLASSAPDGPRRTSWFTAVSPLAVP